MTNNMDINDMRRMRRMSENARNAEASQRYMRQNAGPNRLGTGHSTRDTGMSRGSFLRGAGVLGGAVAAAGLGWGGVARATWVPDSTDIVIKVTDSNGDPTEIWIYPSGPDLSGTAGTTLFPHPLNGTAPLNTHGPNLGLLGTAQITLDALHVQLAMLNAASGATIRLKSTTSPTTSPTNPTPNMPAEFRFGVVSGPGGSFGVRITKDVNIIGDTNSDGTPATVIVGGMVPIGCSLPKNLTANCLTALPPGPVIEIKNISFKNYLRFLNAFQNKVGISIQYTNGATIENCKLEIADFPPFLPASIPGVGAFGIVFNHTNPWNPGTSIPVHSTCEPINILHNHFIGTNTAAGITVVYFFPNNCPVYTVSGNTIELDNSAFPPGNDYGAINFYGNVKNAICNDNTILGSAEVGLSLLRIVLPSGPAYPENCSFSGNIASDFYAKSNQVFIGPYSYHNIFIGNKFGIAGQSQVLCYGNGNYFGYDPDTQTANPNIFGPLSSPPKANSARITVDGYDNTFFKDIYIGDAQPWEEGHGVWLMGPHTSGNNVICPDVQFELKHGFGTLKDYWKDQSGYNKICCSYPDYDTSIEDCPPEY